MTPELRQFLRFEIEHRLYDYRIGSIQLWNMYRCDYRYQYESQVSGVTQRTNLIRIWTSIAYMLRLCSYSFWCCLRLLFQKNVENVIFANGRLQCDEGVYYDKFTDPVIDLTSLQNSCRIFQIQVNMSYCHKRRHEEILIPVDFIVLLSYLLVPFCAIKHLVNRDYKVINNLCKEVRKITPVSRRGLIKMHFYYLVTIIQASLYKQLFRRIHLKRLFGVGRLNFESAIIAAHKLGVPVFEFQHGITMGDTAYYSGPQCPIMTPDFFLAFGSVWKGNQFGIDPQSIINIGWAYKNEKKVQHNLIPQSVLFVSSPEISHNILQCAVELADQYPNYQFYIRCHPYEKYTDKQIKIVDSHTNLFMDDNSVDSMNALSKYEYIVGENSSVIFEALSLGKKVGRLCFNGLMSPKYENIEQDDFFYLYKKTDFDLFVNSDLKYDNSGIYSDFDRQLFDSLPKKN